MLQCYERDTHAETGICTPQIHTCPALLYCALGASFCSFLFFIILWYICYLSSGTVDQPPNKDHSLPPSCCRGQTGTHFYVLSIFSSFATKGDVSRATKCMQCPSGFFGVSKALKSITKDMHVWIFLQVIMKYEVNVSL